MPNELENTNVSTGNESEELSPFDMFLRDLEADEVSSQSEEEVAIEENAGADLPPDAVGEAVLEAEKVSEPLMVSPSIAMPLKVEAPAEVVQHEPLQEEEEINEEEFLDKFYANPHDAIYNIANKIGEKIANEKIGQLRTQIQPALEMSEKANFTNSVRSVITDFVARTADARDYLSDMTDYIKANNLPADDDNSYVLAYNASKMAKMADELNTLRANSGKTLADYYADENSVNDMVNNPTIRDRVINEYLNGLQNGGKPMTIQSGGTVQPTAQPVNRPKTLDEAGKLFAENMFR